MSMKPNPSVLWRMAALAGGLLTLAGPVVAESYVLPSSAFRSGANGAEYRTDVRILNQGTAAVTVSATFYDQVTSTTVMANPFQIEARNQAALDNVLQSLFGRTLGNGSYGPIRFDVTGPVLVSASVNNENACGSGAISGQWLPGIVTTEELKAGVIGQLAVSASTGSGYRTNLVFMNPGSTAATATVTVRRGRGTLLSTGTIGPLAANGFSQVALDSAVFPGVAGSTDTNLWLEFTSDQPVLAYATVIHNVSGDSLAVVASADAAPAMAVSSYLPSSSFRVGMNGAEYRTDVRILNLSAAAVTVNATLYDQETSAALSAIPFQIEGRSQASFDNILQSMFGMKLSDGAYGPIRFAATGPIVVGASVNNVNACGAGAVAGQWLPGIEVPQALKAGVIGQLAVSADSTSGFRSNFVLMNPGNDAATARVRVWRGVGELLYAGTVGPLPANGFRQLKLENLPRVAETTDTNLWLEFHSDQPVLAYATVIHNVSGDPFAVVASHSVMAPAEMTLTLPGGVPLVLVRVLAGTFQMGSPWTERNRRSGETLHEVTLTSDYYLGKYEVTQAQWQSVMGRNPSYFETCGGDCPVERVSWDDIRGEKGFIAKLNQLLGTTAFRLPTEAEWERAARGGTQTRFSFGDALDTDDLCGAFPAAMPYLWWCGNGGGKTHPVGTRGSNPYGLFDMHGNVTEVTEDFFEDYSAEAQTNPTGPAMGTARVLRGGGWGSALRHTRSAFRGYGGPGFRGYDIGFRLARSQ